MEASPGVSTATRNALRLVFFIMLLDVMGLTILIPVTPYIVQR